MSYLGEIPSTSSSWENNDEASGTLLDWVTQGQLNAVNQVSQQKKQADSALSTPSPSIPYVQPQPPSPPSSSSSSSSISPILIIGAAAVVFYMIGKSK